MDARATISYWRTDSKYLLRVFKYIFFLCKARSRYCYMTTIDSEECLVIIFITYFDQFIKNKIFAKILKGGLKNFPGIWLQKCQQLEALPNLGGVLDGKKTRPKKAEFCRVFFSMKNSPLIGSCQLMFTFWSQILFKILPPED